MSSRVSGLRVTFLPVGSPIMPVKSPIRKITVMAEVLELPHLVEQHRVAEMQIRRGRIESGLDPQRAAELEARLELLALDDLVGAAADESERGLQIGHWISLLDGSRGRDGRTGPIECAGSAVRNGRRS